MKYTKEIYNNTLDYTILNTIMTSIIVQVIRHLIQLNCKRRSFQHIFTDWDPAPNHSPIMSHSFILLIIVCLHWSAGSDQQWSVVSVSWWVIQLLSHSFNQSVSYSITHLPRVVYGGIAKIWMDWSLARQRKSCLPLLRMWSDTVTSVLSLSHWTPYSTHTQTNTRILEQQSAMDNIADCTIY